MPKINKSEISTASTDIQNARLAVLAKVNELKSIENEFSNSTELKGNGWTNAKQHQQMVTPIAQALSNTMSDTGEKLMQYLSSFESEVGSPKNKLNTDDLEELNTQLKDVKKEKVSTLKQISKLNDNLKDKGLLDYSTGDYATMAFDEAIASINKDIEILEKYRTFEAAHANDFLEIKTALSNVITGLEQLSNQGSYDASTGKYGAMDKNKATWLQALASYNSTQPSERKEYVKKTVTVTDKNGQTRAMVVYDVYVDGEYNYGESSKLKAAMEEAEMRTGLKFLSDVSGATDIIEALGGVDPFTGEKITSDERAIAIVMSIVTLLSAGTAAKVLKSISKGEKIAKEVNVAEELAKTTENGGVESITEPLKNAPYIKDGKPNGRPQLSGKKKLEFENDVYNNQVDPDGILRDPNTGDVIDWQPGSPRKGKVDFGHIAGNSYKKMFEKYKNKEISLEELKEFQYNPDNFRLEIPSVNRSHQYE